MDFEEIKEHEAAYVANSIVKKAQRSEDIRSKIKQAESAYKLPPISKAYDQAKEQMSQQRLNPNSKLMTSQETRQRIKKYDEKIKQLRQLEEKPPRPEFKGKLSGTGTGESVYGRFGKQWERTLNQHELDAKYKTEVKEKGSEYLQFSKQMKSSKGAPNEERREEPEEEQERLQKELNTRNQAKGMEYLRHARAMASKKAVSGDKPKVGGSEGKELVRVRLSRMDQELGMIEAAERNRAGQGRDMDQVYLQNIKAKLALLEDI